MPGRAARTVEGGRCARRLLRRTRRRQGDRDLAARIARLKRDLHDTDDIQYRARQLTEDMAIALQAKLLLEAGNSAVSDAFIASRLATSRRAYGTLPCGIALPPILDRSSPD